MRTVSRRELNHHLAQVLDEVLATGEPVEIVTRGAQRLVLSLKSESLYEGWVRLGVVDDRPPDLDVLDSIVPVKSVRSSREVLADVRDDR